MTRGSVGRSITRALAGTLVLFFLVVAHAARTETDALYSAIGA